MRISGTAVSQMNLSVEPQSLFLLLCKKKRKRLCKPQMGEYVREMEETDTKMVKI